jgi:hypothetical protein
MSALLKSASSTYLLLTPLYTSSEPFSFGLWAYFVSLPSVGTLWMATDTFQHNFMLEQVSSTSLRWRYNQISDKWVCTNTFTVVTNVWYYLLARRISNTNARLSTLDTSTGIVAHSSDATSNTDGSVTENIIGAADSGSGTPDSNFLNGCVAEYFYVDTDVQIGGGQAADELIRQLAYRGPWSVPHVAASMVEYHGFQQAVGSNTDNFKDIYQRGGRRSWTMSSTVPTTGNHPPLSRAYVRPGQNASLFFTA